MGKMKPSHLVGGEGDSVRTVVAHLLPQFAVSVSSSSPIRIASLSLYAAKLGLLGDD